MALDAVELIVVRLALVRPFVTATGATTHRDVLLVRVVADGVEGWGECGAASDASYWHETVDTARAALPALARGARIGGHPMAHAALEMAELDARLRREGRSLAAHLGATRERVVATATAGFDDDIDAFVAAGYRSVKVKVAPDHPLTRAPSDVGVAVQVDANASYASCPERIDELDELGLSYIEQPLAADDLDAHASLAARLRTPLCLDESVGSLDALDRAMHLRAAAAYSIKPARLGGIAAAREAHDRCVRAGIAAKVGGLLETGIGRAAALAVAGLPGFTMPADLSASDRYWAEDVTEPFVLDGDGCLTVPSGPGLGVAVRRDLVDRVATWRERAL